MMVSQELTMAKPEKTGKTATPMSPRRKRYWMAIGISAAIGGLLGAWMQIDNSAGPAAGLASISNGALTPGFAKGASALWVVGLILSLVLYHRAIDDHEERAYLWACLTSWYAIVLATPAWWVLHRADLAPPVDAMILFLVALVANAVVWLWLKFR